ncbi:hypothetical protein HDU67_004586 [Dinochytrium kinnereticum]|nr:hypothetical protein HDU67_004586 [Dinochytrium kinnereticum]
MKKGRGGSKAGVGNRRRRNQGLRYILVLDFEATCGPTVPKQEQEIIEFPIVVVDTLEHKIIDTFHTHVRPTLHPILDPYCTELTGVTQAQVDQSPTLIEALQQAADFADPYLTNRAEKSALLTCGDWDLITILPQQASREGLEIPWSFRTYINLKEDFSEFYRKQRQKSFTSMMGALGLEVEGRHHSGLDDSRSIARIVLRMVEEGHVFTVPVRRGGS